MKVVGEGKIRDVEVVESACGGEYRLAFFVGAIYRHSSHHIREEEANTMP